MLTVHHLATSQSERIVWLCEELEIPYQLKVYQRDPTTRLAPPDYKALHPVGTAPIITDGDLVLPESGAIIEYIIARYGNGRLALPANHPDFARYLFWLHYANGSMMPRIMSALLVGMIGGQENPTLKFVRTRMESAFDLTEQRLGEAPYFAGRVFTAADINMFFPLTTMRSFMPIDFANRPHVRAYLQRVGERPAYRRAMEKGDPGRPLPLS